MARDVLVDGRAVLAGDDDGSVGTDDDSGFFYRDTRHLSAFDVRVENADLATLGREFRRPNRRIVVSSTAGSAVNSVDDSGQIKQGTLSLRLDQRVTETGGLDQRVELATHASPFEGRVVCTFAVYFADIFEVRGFASGVDRSVETDRSDRAVRYTHRYRDTDGNEHERQTAVAFDRCPASLVDGRATFETSLDAGHAFSLDVEVRPDASPEASGGVSGYRTDGGPLAEIPAFETGDGRFDELLTRSCEDLRALTTRTEHGPVLLAGAPWFATVFGRDSLIAAYQTLPLAPSFARGTLRYLAAHRGEATDEVTEEAPGKMFHEERTGELARREQIPHTPYYGTVDATPLWVVLLGELWRWTGDADAVRELETPLAAALDWIDGARDRLGDGPFLYYDQSPDVGLRHKAWRDTPGSVQYPDGRSAEPPIASVEVQGYVYRALREAATLYEDVLADPRRGAALREEAAQFAAAFDTEFWVEETDFYAAAKDGNGDVVPTPTSNVGHCLWADVVPEERVSAVADRLLSSEMFSGWGVRTMSPSAEGYSPVSYHLGSVWPHDSSLTALGLARAGRYGGAERLARSLLEACTRFDDYRIPELFCGFDDDVDPLTYPSSCVPQAWSAATPVALLRASFGVDPDGESPISNRPAFLVDAAVDPLLN